ncbi:aspartate/glutamate racemase family protein [Paucibacter sp. Y2R2-4]|uniref:aspartate/glutamate racemase family protein n=1 Tax=Paucibacter sp. Y2R2-4 TaxID=2893553 RepID=UPI0021E465F3|nr:aspartate/glutamate racemase family protein [Paucibacter sp. Y2R2-4]MCV2350853.1 aspartate/glutamate racemase family protein [Paucibacter sp. Y2R2-4]
MKTLGILGGMSWESSALLYQLLNREVAERLGGLNSADLLLRSVNFAEIEALQRAGDWAGAARVLGEAGLGLKSAGAQALLIATNTMHKVADEVEALSGLPLIHIVDVTAQALQAAGVRRVGLLATRYTMEEDFYSGRMLNRHGIETLMPAPAQRLELHRVIFEELCRGQIRAESRAFYLQVVQDLAAAGAEAVILGCTEIALLLDPQVQAALPLFDSTALQAQAAVEWMLGGTTAV